jgi:hypothetical protein
MKSREIVLRLAYWKILDMGEFGPEAISTETMVECAKKTLAAYTGTVMTASDQHFTNNFVAWLVEAKDFLQENG